MQPISMAVLERLIDKRHFHLRTAQLIVNADAELKVARDARHGAGHDRVHLMVFPTREHEHAVDFRPVAIAAIESSHSFRASASCWSLKVSCFACASVGTRQ